MADPLESCKGSPSPRNVAPGGDGHGKVALVGGQADPEIRNAAPARGTDGARRIGGSLVRWVLGAILLLSLPTFSDWIPRRSGPEPAGTQPVSAAQAEAGFVTRSRSAGGGSSGFSSGSFSGVGTGFPRESGRPSAVERARLQRGAGPARAGMAESHPPLAAASRSGDPSPGRRENRGALPRLAAQAAARGELSQLDAEYETMLQTFLPGGTGSWARNPFVDFLFSGGTTGDGSGGSDDGTGGEGGNGGTGGAGNGGGGTPGGGGGTPGGGGGTPGGGGDTGGGGGGDTGGGGGPEPPANPGDDLGNRFLVMLPPGAAGGEVRLVAATRSASGFVLDGGGEIALFPGIVGFTRPALLLDQGEMVVSGPPQAGKGWPYFVFNRTTFGTALRGFLYAGATFRPWLDAFFYYNLAYSVAPFDVDSDGIEELVTAELKTENLVVYDVQSGGLRYERELALPFRPWYVVRTDVLKPVRTQFLQVFDQKLNRFVTFSSRFPGVYSFSAPPSWVGEETVRIESTGGEQFREYLVQVYTDQVVFFLLSGQERLFLASVHVSVGSPLVVLGDFRGTGRHTVVILP
ncbi:MAG: hypothetical protein Kow00109_10990 [Acidobacteriota bacterium]